MSLEAINDPKKNEYCSFIPSYHPELFRFLWSGPGFRLRSISHKTSPIFKETEIQITQQVVTNFFKFTTRRYSYRRPYSVGEDRSDGIFNSDLQIAVNDRRVLSCTSKVMKRSICRLLI